MATALAYVGPQCPRCGILLSENAIRSGVITCEICKRAFEATAFTALAPPRAEVVETIVVAGPAGANACANHERNAAVTSCQRCGLFICSLCDMNVGAGSYCPSCFDRVRAEGTLKPVVSRYRDYASMARLTAIIGLIFYFVWPIVGAAAIYFATKGMRQRREQGRSRAGMIIVMLIGIGEVIAGFTLFGFLVWAFMRGTKL
jgi:ribosomal protein L37AE/L43A